MSITKMNGLQARGTILKIIDIKFGANRALNVALTDGGGNIVGGCIYGMPGTIAGLPENDIPFFF